MIVDKHKYLLNKKLLFFVKKIKKLREIQTRQIV